MKVEWYPCTAETPLLVPAPRPASHYTPEWYRSLPNLGIAKNKKFSLVDGSPQMHKNVKSCAPFLDAYMSGYIQETWTDIYIEKNANNSVSYYYASGPEIMSTRNGGGSLYCGDQHYDIEFVWRQPWVPKLPNGYSMLFVHPLNHHELPFESFSAVVDSDEFIYDGFPNNYPFRIKKDFVGLIPAGTPMYQMIPVKRDSWRGKEQSFNESFFTTETAKISRYFTGAYKKFFWKRKRYF